MMMLFIVLVVLCFLSGLITIPSVKEMFDEPLDEDSAIDPDID